jgi:hypothetical protein
MGDSLFLVSFALLYVGAGFVILNTLLGTMKAEPKLVPVKIRSGRLRK